MSKSIYIKYPNSPLLSRQMGEATVIKKVSKKMSQKLNLSDLTLLAGQLKMWLPHLQEQAKEYMQDPIKLGPLLEEAHPQLGKIFYGAAANLQEPFSIGMGLQLLAQTEDAVEVQVPFWWRNKGRAGHTHHATYLVAGEWAAGLFWQRHLGTWANWKIEKVQVDVLKEAQSTARGKLQISEADCQQVLYKIRSEGEAAHTIRIHFFDDKEQMLADLSLDLKFKKIEALGPGHEQH